MSKQGAYPVLTDDVVETETVEGREASSGAALMATPDISMAKSPKAIDHVSWKVSNGGKVTWKVTGIASDETLVIEPASDSKWFTFSNPSNDTVEATIDDGKGPGGTDETTVLYSVSLRGNNGLVPLFGRANPFTDEDPEPYLVIDSLGGPPTIWHPGPRHSGHGR